MKSVEYDSKNFYIQEILKVCDKEQLDEIVLQEDSELEGDFLGFLEQYYHLSKIIPTHYTVIDFGAYVGIQGLFFRKHRKYITVDSCDLKRYEMQNSEHFVCTIKQFLQEHGEELKDKTETIFAICNYVPSKQTALVRKFFKNVFVFYPAGRFDWEV